LKSPTAAEAGLDPAPKPVGALSPIEELGVVTSKKSTFDVPPPGVGFTTVTEAVAAFATSEARILAVSRDRLTKVVVRGLPFHFTTELETKPVPFTVSVNAAPPGLAASGTRGWLIRGAGFSVLVSTLLASSACCASCAARRAGVAGRAIRVIALIKTNILGFIFASFGIPG
jgi:hypothetical protein